MRVESLESLERIVTIREYAIQCIKDEAQAVLDLIPQMDENFDRAVELIMNCHGKIIVTGVGKSGHIGAKIAATLASTGTPSFFINPLDVGNTRPVNVWIRTGTLVHHAAIIQSSPALGVIL